LREQEWVNAHSFVLKDVMRMEENEIIEKLWEDVERIVKRHGARLVDIELKGKGRKLALVVTIDRAEGVTVQDCADVSEDLSAWLDIVDPIQGSYSLQVQSPGLDRPLKRLRDYLDCIGKIAKVVTAEPIEGSNVWIGRIEDVVDDVLQLDVEDKGIVNIPLEKITKANLEVRL